MDGHDAMLERRRTLLAEGARPLGWKLGFGSAAAQEQLGTSAPLIGFVTDRGLIEAGATVSLDGYANAALEPEVAVYLDADGAVREVGAAFELVDIHPFPSPVAQILAGNIFHRGVVLGGERATSLDGLRARLYRDGELIAETDDVGALNGDQAAGAEHVARTVGPELAAGDVVLTGSVVAAVPVKPGETYRYELDPIGSLELRFA